MRRKEKNNWDYFCDLLIAVPGLASMFEDDAKKETLLDGIPGDMLREKKDAAGDTVPTHA